MRLANPHVSKAAIQKTHLFCADIDFDLMPLFRSMSGELNIDVRFLLALSSRESGWNGQHAQDLHNLFGVTHGGGNNFNYPSYEAGANDWISRYGSFVSGAKTIDEFVEGLKKAHYNSVEPKYFEKIKAQLDSVDKWADRCDVP